MKIRGWMHYGALGAGLLFIATVAPLPAQVVWIGDGNVNNLSTPGNWAGTFVGDGTDDAVFPSLSASYATIHVPSDATLHDISFTNGVGNPYDLDGNYDGSELTLNGDLGLGDNSSVNFGGGFEFILPTGTHSFTIGNYSTLTIDSPITGPGGITLSGPNVSALYLSGDNTGWTGGLTITGNNYVGVDGIGDRGLGTGPVSFDSASSGQIGLDVSTTINSLSGGQSSYDLETSTVYGSKITLDEGVGLTVNQAGNTTYAGGIEGYYYGEGPITDGGLRKTGAGTLTLTGAVVVYGSTSVEGGSLVVNGSTGGIFYSESLEVSNGASATITAGGDVTTNYGYIATGGSGGTVTVTGTGSLWDVGDLVVGAPSGGTGVLNIAAGGVVSASAVTISETGPSTSHLNVGGAGTQLNVDGSLRVGKSGGNARLNITTGGTVTSLSGDIGYNGYGDTTVRGTGSTWTIANNLTVASGGGSTGYFKVFDNGRLNVGGTGGIGTITLASGGGAGTLTVGESESLVGVGGIINATTITTDTGTGLIRFDTDNSSSTPYYLTKDGTANGTAVLITGPTSVNNQQGYNVLKGTNTYTGATTITGGTLVYGATNAFGTGSVTVNGGALRLADGFGNIPNALTLTSGTVAGNWTFATPQSFGAGITLSPGNSPGTMTFASGLTLTGTGGASTIEIVAPTNVPGTSADLIAVTGTLNLSGLTSYTLNVISLLPDNVTPGAVSGLSTALPTSWTIFTSTTLTGFDAGDFTINSSAFVNAGNFSLTSSGNNLQLNFTPVPEPSTYALMLAGLGLSGLAAWRKRRRS